MKKKEKREEKIKECKEIIGKIIFPHFVSFANFLSSKNIKCNGVPLIIPPELSPKNSIYIQINGAYYDNEASISLKLELDYSLSIHDLWYNEYNGEIMLMRDVAFDEYKYRESFENHKNEWYHNEGKYDSRFDNTNRQGVAHFGKIRNDKIININNCNESFIMQELFGWLDTLIKNKLLQ